MMQVIIFQIPALNGNPIRDAIATVFPALTAAVVGIQLKLEWGNKGKKAKKGTHESNNLCIAISAKFLEDFWVLCDFL